MRGGGRAAERLPSGNHTYQYRTLRPFLPTLTFQVTAHQLRLRAGGLPSLERKHLEFYSKYNRKTAEERKQGDLIAVTG